MAPPFERCCIAAEAASVGALCGCIGLGGALNFCTTQAHCDAHSLASFATLPSYEAWTLLWDSNSSQL